MTIASEQLKSFSFGGVHLAGYNLYLATMDFPVLPKTRDKIYDIPGRNGKLDLGAEIAERPFPLPCILRAESEDAYWWSVEAIAALFEPSKGAQKLILDDRPDRYLIARYSGQLNIRQAIQWGEFELPLVAWDPYFYAVNADTIMANITYNGQQITVTKDVRSLAEYPQIRIINAGTTAVTGIKITRVNNP